METRVITTATTPDWLRTALAVLGDGGLVAAATETVYGLAGDATKAEAVAAIFEAKGRPSHNPLIAHVSGKTMAGRYGMITPLADQLMTAFWPGPLTLVLPLRRDAGLADAVTAGGQSVALRSPRGTLGDLATALGRPLAAPSANRSGHVSPTTAQHVHDDLAGRIELILDTGSAPTGLESTIVDCRTDTPLVLRAGTVTHEELEASLGMAIGTGVSDSAAPVAPGQLESHYAPGVPVRLNVTPDHIRPGEAYLGFDGWRAPGQANLSMTGDLVEAATNLYALLRQLDGQNPTGIAVAPIPEIGLGHAINDRLKRAAALR